MGASVSSDITNTITCIYKKQVIQFVNQNQNLNDHQVSFVNIIKMR